jgi:hypothetical protein
LHWAPPSPQPRPPAKRRQVDSVGAVVDGEGEGQHLAALEEGLAATWRAGRRLTRPRHAASIGGIGRGLGGVGRQQVLEEGQGSLV